MPLAFTQEDFLVIAVLANRSIKVISKLPKIPSGTNQQLTF